jgi:hypothetical protein
MYTPLNVTKRQIRLLYLFPGDDDDELVCAFTRVSLDDQPDFEAISYVWGDWKDPGSIENALVEEAIPITKNLQSVLRNVRLRDRWRVLWVDALCINQQDLDERGSQVQMMADIYHSATRVLAYLGDHFDGCELAFEAMRQLSEDKTLHFVSHLTPGLNINGSGLEAPEMMENMRNFFDTPWITRAWTVQEFVCAKDVVFLYGKMTTSWEIPMMTCQNFFENHLMCCNEDLLSYRHYEAFKREMENWAHLHIASMRCHFGCTSLYQLDLFRRRIASDQRDKVYSFVGLGNPTWARNLGIDYRTGMDEVFKRTVISDFGVTGRLEFLNFCYVRTESNIPSWVTDWSVFGRIWQSSQARSSSTSNFRASGAYLADVEFCLDNTLAVGGVVVSRVSLCSDVFFDHDNAVETEQAKEALETVYRSLREAVNITGVYGRTDKYVLEACRLALMGGLEWDNNNRQWRRLDTITDQKEFEELKALYGIDSRCLGGQHEVDRAEGSRCDGLSARRSFDMSTALFSAIRSRRFIILESGYFGFAHKDCQQGDFIVALGGGDMLYTLRLLPTGKYTFIGTAYIQEMMYGEAFEGDAKWEKFIIV